MKAIDATQLIINRMKRTSSTIVRDDLMKVLYLLDNEVFKESGKHLVDEKFSFSNNEPFIEDVYERFTLWKKDDYSYKTVEVEHSLEEKEFDKLENKIYELGMRSSWELNAMVYNQLNQGKRLELNSDIIANHNKISNEILDRCRLMLELVKTRVEFKKDKNNPGLYHVVPDDLYWLKKLDTSNIYFSIKEQDDGDYKMNWCSHDTFDGLGEEEAIIPADFINNFDEYYNKIKTEIEVNNEVEKEKDRKFQLKAQKKSKKEEIAKLQAEIAKKTEELNALKKASLTDKLSF